MFDLPPLFAHIAELVTLVLISGIAAGVGLRMLRLLRLDAALGLGERLVFSLALGYGALGLLMLAMGLLGIIYLPVGLALLLVLALLGFGPLLSALRGSGPAFRVAWATLRYPPNLFLSIVILLAVLTALAQALAPAITQDDLMYHLALPRRYIEAHAVRFYPDSTYSLFPQLMEMLYTWGLLLGSDRLAMLFAFSMGLLGPLAAVLFARDRGLGAKALPLLAAAVFLSMPLIGYILRAANNDLAQASYDMLAVYAFWLGVRGKQAADRAGKESKLSSAFILSGLYCGLSLSVKYYGFAVALALGIALLALVIAGRRRCRAAISPLSLLYFGAPIVALALPWLLRNYIASGNPVWPLAGGIFGGSYWSPQASPETLLGKAPGLGAGNLWAGLQYLWDAMSRPPLLIDNQVHVVNLGPLLLPALLTLFFVRWRTRLALVAYAGAAYWLLWAFFFSQTSARYLSTFFLLGALLGAYGLAWLITRYRLLRWTLGGVVALTLALLALDSGLSIGPYLPTALSLDRTAEQQYLSAYMEDYSVMQYISQRTPPNATIYVWDGQPRGYYIARKYIYGRLVPLYSGVSSDLAGWHARLSALGVTHVLVHKRDVLAPGQLPGSDPYAQIFTSFSAEYLGPPLFTSGDYSLYQFTSY